MPLKSFDLYDWQKTVWVYVKNFAAPIHGKTFSITLYFGNFEKRNEKFLSFQKKKICKNPVKCDHKKQNS